MAAKRRTASSGPPAGIGVDAHGGGVVDPSVNVQALNEASVKRLDDLREVTNSLYDAKIAHGAEMANLRAQYATELGEVRADHAKELRETETHRLDAIRQVDQLTATTAADRAAQATQALAVRAATDAETLRGVVATTATAQGQTTSQQFSAVIERIAALEKSSYQGQGRSTATDPMLEQLLAKVNGLSNGQQLNAGKSEGLSIAGQMLLGVVAIIGVLIAAAVYLRPVAAPAPIIPPAVYIPAPANPQTR